jgi:hypothetical protein
MKEDNYSMVSHTKKIWIDLENSPHVPFFKLIIEELNKRGYAVMLTARDCFNDVLALNSGTERCAVREQVGKIAPQRD